MFKNKIKNQNKSRNHKNLVTVIKASDNQYVQQLEEVYVEEIIPITLEKAKDDASHNVPSSETKTSPSPPN